MYGNNFCNIPYKHVVSRTFSAPCARDRELFVE